MGNFQEPVNDVTVPLNDNTSIFDKYPLALLSNRKDCSDGHLDLTVHVNFISIRQVTIYKTQIVYFYDKVFDAIHRGKRDNRKLV